MVSFPIIYNVERIGDNALSLVEQFAGGVAKSPPPTTSRTIDSRDQQILQTKQQPVAAVASKYRKRKKKLDGGGGTVFDDAAKIKTSSPSSVLSNSTGRLSVIDNDKTASLNRRDKQVWEALSNLESGSKLLITSNG